MLPCAYLFAWRNTNMIPAQLSLSSSSLYSSLEFSYSASSNSSFSISDSALLFLILFISILNIYYLLRKFITTRPQGLKNIILQNPSMACWWIWHIWFCYMCLFPDYNLVAASSNMLSQRIIAWWHVGDTNFCIVGKFTFTATFCLE